MNTVPLPDNNPTQQLLALLNRHLGPLDQNRLSMSTSINHDLECDGDDAAELIAEFAERFSIDFIDYDAYRYFRPEGYDVMKWRRARNRRGKTPLTLAMLYQAIDRRRWLTEELESLPK